MPQFQLSAELKKIKLKQKKTHRNKKLLIARGVEGVNEKSEGNIVNTDNSVQWQDRYMNLVQWLQLKVYVELLCSTPETNTILYANYTKIILKQLRQVV